MRAPTQKELIAALQAQQEALQQEHTQLWKELARVGEVLQAQDSLRTEVEGLRDQMRDLERSYDRLLTASVLPPPAGGRPGEQGTPPPLATDDLADQLIVFGDDGWWQRLKCWGGRHEPIPALRGKSCPQCLHCERFYSALDRRSWRERWLARIVAAYLLLAVLGFLLIAKVYPWLITRSDAAHIPVRSEMTIPAVPCAATSKAACGW